MHKEISVDQWGKFLDNPRQRDTERHAKAALQKHLKEYNQRQAQVDAGVLPDGTIYKLDGHTRALVWERGQLKQPPVLFCTFWPCRDIEEVKSLYDTFDSQGAVETSSDKIAGAKREHNLVFKSPILKGDKFTYALKTATATLHSPNHAKSLSTPELVGMWIPELHLLDTLNAKPATFPTGLMASALISFRRYGDRILPFWKAYAERRGEKNATHMDPVHALEERVQDFRIRRRMTGDANIREMVCVALATIDRYIDGASYQVQGSGVRPIYPKSLAKWAKAALAARP
jgi:hypothetical protein